MRRLAIVASLLVLASPGPAEESPDRAVHRLDLTSPEPPFLCDSVIPQDCLEMFQRYRGGRTDVARTPGTEPVSTAPSAEDVKPRRPPGPTAPR